MKVMENHHSQPQPHQQEPQLPAGGEHDIIDAEIVHEGPLATEQQEPGKELVPITRDTLPAAPAEQPGAEQAQRPAQETVGRRIGGVLLGLFRGRKGAADRRPITSLDDYVKRQGLKTPAEIAGPGRKSPDEIIAASGRKSVQEYIAAQRFNLDLRRPGEFGKPVEPGRKIRKR